MCIPGTVCEVYHRKEQVTSIQLKGRAKIREGIKKITQLFMGHVPWALTPPRRPYRAHKKVNSKVFKNQCFYMYEYVYYSNSGADRRHAPKIVKLIFFMSSLNQLINKHINWAINYVECFQEDSRKEQKTGALTN